MGQRNAQICASQSELSVLTDAFMTAQRECTETEGRINEIAGLNHSLSGQKDVILPNKLHEIESATAQKQRLLHEKKLNYKDMILSQENKLKGYLARVARFEDNLALCCSVNKGTESVRCAFTHILRDDPQREFWFVLKTDSLNHFRISACSEQETDPRVFRFLEQRVNDKGHGLKKFIKLMRKYFELRVQTTQTQTL